MASRLSGQFLATCGRVQIKEYSNVNTILRITNLPTETKNPGRHAELLNELPETTTIYVTDTVLGETRLEKEGVEIYRLPLTKRRLYSLIQIAILIVRKRPELVAIHLYWFIPLSMLRIGPRFIYHIHGLDQKLFSNRFMNSIWLLLFEKIFSITPMPDERLVYIPNPAYRELANAQKRFAGIEKDKKIIFVGRLDRNKNCAFAIETFKKSGLAEKGYEFSVVGDGEEYSSLKSNYGKLPGLKFHGRLSYDNVLKHLATAKVLIMSSISEGYPKEAIEANMMRANVVSPRFPCFSDSKSPLFYETFSLAFVAKLLCDAVEMDWVELNFMTEQDVLGEYARHLKIN